MNFILEVFVNVFESFVIWYFIQKMLESKYNKITHLITSAVFIAFFFTVVTIINQITILETYLSIFYFLICGIYSVLCYKDKIFKKLFYSAIPLCIIIFSNIITSVLIPIVYDTSTTATVINTDVIRISSIICAKTFQLIITIILSACLKKDSAYLNSIQWLGFSITFVVTFFCAVFVFNIRLTNDELIETEMYILTVICLIIINLSVFTFYISLARKSKENLEYKLNETKIAEQIRTASEIENSLCELRKLRHDIKNQYSCIARMLEDNCLVDAKIYLSELTGNVERELKNTYLISTENYSVNAVFNSFISRCENLDIKIKCDIKNIDYGKVENYDLCSLMSNLMNNAIEAQEKVKYKEIKISFYNKLNYLVFIIENTAEDVSFENICDSKTSKNDNINHGFGISSVKKIVDKYDGIINITNENSFVKFEIWLNLL